MKLFVISDLHISIARPKPMDVFGAHWADHAMRIRARWMERVGPDDVVLLGGDTSWSMTYEDALVDLAWVSELPGKKIVIKGNHDFWWSHKNKLAARFPDIVFLQNNAVDLGFAAISGTRGWMIPGEATDESDVKIYRRELLRMEESLRSAAAMDADEIIALIHYPPTPDGRDTEMTQLFERYGVRRVYFGHIHDEEGYRYCFTGYKNGVEYRLTSCDHIGFDLMDISVESDFERPAALLKQRRKLIDELERGALDKAGFIDANAAMFDGIRGDVPETVRSIEDGVLKYNYFNTLAKRKMLEADRYEYCDPHRFRELREEAHRIYKRKDCVTESFLEHVRSGSKPLRMESYLIETGSVHLTGRMIEIVFPDLDRVVFHTMSDRIRGMLSDLDEKIRPSVIEAYVKTKNCY